RAFRAVASADPFCEFVDALLMGSVLRKILPFREIAEHRAAEEESRRDDQHNEAADNSCNPQDNSQPRAHLSSPIFYYFVIDSASIFSARQILSGACVDTDNLAFVDEQRYAYDGAGLELRRFRSTGRRVATHARVGFDDFEFDVRGRSDLKRLTIPQH